MKSNWFANLRNVVDFPLRQFFKWERPLTIRNEEKDGLFGHLAENERLRAWKIEKTLRQDFHLEKLYQHSGAKNYRENLFYLEMLLRALNTSRPSLPQTLVAADIGPSHWFYVQALYAALKWWHASKGRQINLTGFEVDAYRVYGDFRARRDHALAHVRDLNTVQYLPQKFVKQPETFDVIMMLFPFVFIRDHLQWGLPTSLFDPVQLLKEAWDSLRPSGLLLIVNQGEQEHIAQKEMLACAGISPVSAFQHESILFEYDLPRFVLVAVRNE
ncbi:MAG: hypothetical protein H6636_11365 [Anaerolineales bacterium]|nr:hypothetical protein [Anaerolineales bacterium]